MKPLSRRSILVGAGACALAASARSSTANAAAPSGRKLLFVVCATGGANIIDSFMPVASDEVAPEDAERLTVFSPGELYSPAGSNIRCVRPLENTAFLQQGFTMPEFLDRHHRAMTVVAHDVTSVNHLVGQYRSVTGAGINAGRTLAEAVAEVHGEGLPLANLNMASDGFANPGSDPDLVGYARQQTVVDPLQFALSTHGTRGLSSAPTPERIERSRALRDGLDQVSPFARSFRNTEGLARYLELRAQAESDLEASDAITKLMLRSDLPAGFDLPSSPMLPRLRQAFPELDRDIVSQQAALAFLQTFYGLGCASTLSLRLEPQASDDGIETAPLAFDFSHSMHRPTQNVMWGRLLGVVDGLISLLQEFDYLGDPAQGKMWDRTLIYIATEFGRERIRTPGLADFGTGHRLNNGAVFISPLLRGNAVFGGVDPTTLDTYGFDPRSGAPDPARKLVEGDIYAIAAQALDVEYAARAEFPSVLS